MVPPLQGQGFSAPKHYLPVRIPTLDEEGIVRLAAGDAHSMAVARDGSVFTWGCNSHGQVRSTVVSGVVCLFVCMYVCLFVCLFVSTRGIEPTEVVCIMICLLGSGRTRRRALAVSVYDIVESFRCVVLWRRSAREYWRVCRVCLCAAVSRGPNQRGRASSRPEPGRR